MEERAGGEEVSRFVVELNCIDISYTFLSKKFLKVYHP
jgi:hypothetical protein